MRQLLQTREKTALKSKNQTITRDSSPVVSIITCYSLKYVNNEYSNTQCRQLALRRHAQSERRTHSGATMIDKRADAVHMRVRAQQNVDDIFEGQRKCER
jgi:hypothetical protein